MIEIEYEGPRLRWLGLLLADFLAITVAIIVNPDQRKWVTWQGAVLLAIGVVAAAGQILDGVRWARHRGNEEDGERR